MSSEGDMVSLSGAYTPLDRGAIEAFEAESGVWFPETYTEFLLASNGGRPTPENVLEVPGWEFGSTVISFFFGLKTGDAYDLAANIRRYHGRIPADCIPIATDAAGNKLCLKVRGDHLGRVYFWDHENEREDPDDYGNMYVVAESIAELLDRLEPG